MTAQQSVGFTGTQHGMTPAQSVAVASFLTTWRDDFRDAQQELHFLYGMCVGADDQAAMIAGNLGFTLHGYPGDNPSKYGHVVPHFRHAPMENLRRNAVIVSQCSALLATPRETAMIRRSGTWATVRAARKAAVPVWLIWPDGAFANAYDTEQENTRV